MISQVILSRANATSDLLKLCFGIYENFLERNLMEIVEENKKLNNVEGFTYLNRNFGFHKFGSLHPILLERMDQYWEKKIIMEKIESPAVTSLFSSAIATGKTAENICKLLPTPTHQTIFAYIPSGDIYITEEEIESFKKRHEKGYSLLNARLVFNLLL